MNYVAFKWLFFYSLSILMDLFGILTYRFLALNGYWVSRSGLFFGVSIIRGVFATTSQTSGMEFDTKRRTQ